jgi:hypothetical protein
VHPLPDPDHFEATQGWLELGDGWSANDALGHPELEALWVDIAEI